jgi:hypothetical protein
MATETASLTYWKPAGKSKPRAPGEIADSLRAGAAPRGVADLPVDEIVAALEGQYPALERTSDTSAEIDIDAEQTGMEFSWGGKYFHCDFFGDAFRQMEGVTALMARFGCSCYWPDEKKLFPPDDPPQVSDPAFDAHMEKVFAALTRQADAAGDPDPMDRLKRVVNFMKSGALEKEIGPPPPRQEATRKHKKGK